MRLNNIKEILTCKHLLHIDKRNRFNEEPHKHEPSLHVYVYEIIAPPISSQGSSPLKNILTYCPRKFRGNARRWNPHFQKLFRITKGT